MPNMAATIRYNPDRTLFEFVNPEGEEYDAADIPRDCIEVIEDPDGGPAYLAVFPGWDGELKPNTVYKLVEVPTEVIEGVEMAVEPEDIEDDDDDDDVEDAPIAS